MAIKGVDDAYLLPCGQDAAILWEHVTIGQLDEHELDCPHCQAASAGFRALREATGELTEADLAPPRDLTERIMRAVRTERRRDAFIPVAVTEWGPIRIAAQAAAVVVRFAADQAGPHRYHRGRHLAGAGMIVGRTVVEKPVAEKLAALTALSTPGVIRLEPSISALAASLSRRALGGWGGGGNGTLPPIAGVRVEVTEGAVTVEVALAIELGRSVPDVAADAQRRVADALRERGGFAVDSVTILVVGVDRA